MEVTINYNVYEKAQTRAQQQGLSLTSVIQKFLMRFIGQDQHVDEQTMPDVVLSLLGAGEPLADDDLNGRKAYYEYLVKNKQQNNI